jgi:hypothetical protein
MCILVLTVVKRSYLLNTLVLQDEAGLNAVCDLVLYILRLLRLKLLTHISNRLGNATYHTEWTAVLDTDFQNRLLQLAIVGVSRGAFKDLRG